MRLSDLACVSSGLLALVSLGAVSALAQDAGTLPNFQVMNCVGPCATVTPAVPIGSHTIPASDFPTNELYGSNYAEGIVSIQEIIGVDGHVRDASVVQLIGPQDFANVALSAVRKWLYKPAEADGIPVEQSSMVHFTFDLPGIGPQARQEVFDKYNDAIALMKQGKLDEGLTKLEEAKIEPQLTLYERTTIAFALALIHEQQGDSLDALDDIRLATLDDGAHLNKQTRSLATETRVKIALENGEVAEAMGEFLALRRQGVTIKPDDPLQQLVKDAIVKTNTLDVISVSARIPKAQDGDWWSHLLFRSNYSFANVVGKLDGFRLVCGQQLMESPITETAEWHVPNSLLTHCQVFVRGTPGTTFQLLESKT